ncbi:MAG: anthranilate synthase component II [Dichotomicrobium sp.]
MITLIDNYDSFTYNLVHYFADLGVDCRVYRNDKIGVDAVLAEHPAAIVLSPGPCDPERAGICLELIKAAAGCVPLLGVCLGMQALGQAFGGDVVRAPALMHGKRSTVSNTGTSLFAGLPPRFEATRYHSLIVDADTLPDCFRVTARTSDGVLMALEHTDHPLYGVQFHPESIASEYGHALLANFLGLAGINWHPVKAGLILPQDEPRTAQPAA